MFFNRTGSCVEHRVSRACRHDAPGRRLLPLPAGQHAAVPVVVPVVSDQPAGRDAVQRQLPDRRLDPLIPADLWDTRCTTVRSPYSARWGADEARPHFSPSDPATRHSHIVNEALARAAFGARPDGRRLRLGSLPLVMPCRVVAEFDPWRPVPASPISSLPTTAPWPCNRAQLRPRRSVERSRSDTLRRISAPSADVPGEGVTMEGRLETARRHRVSARSWSGVRELALLLALAGSMA